MTTSRIHEQVNGKLEFINYSKSSILFFTHRRNGVRTRYFNPANASASLRKSAQLVRGSSTYCNEVSSGSPP